MLGDAVPNLLRFLDELFVVIDGVLERVHVDGIRLVLWQVVILEHLGAFVDPVVALYSQAACTILARQLFNRDGISLSWLVQLRLAVII